VRAGGGAAWREVLRGFWAPFEAAVAATGGVSVTEVIDVLDPLIGAHFLPAQVLCLLRPGHIPISRRC
jgi:DNA topoisomerase-1